MYLVVIIVYNKQVEEKFRNFKLNYGSKKNKKQDKRQQLKSCETILLLNSKNLAA